MTDMRKYGKIGALNQSRNQKGSGRGAVIVRQPDAGIFWLNRGNFHGKKRN
jgi:hypothetical protein